MTATIDNDEATLPRDLAHTLLETGSQAESEGWTAKEWATFSGQIQTARSLPGTATPAEGAALVSRLEKAANGCSVETVKNDEQIVVLTLGATQRNRQGLVFEVDPSFPADQSSTYHLIIKCGNGTAVSERRVTFSGTDREASEPVLFRVPLKDPVQLRFKIQPAGSTGETLAAGVLALGAEQDHLGADRESMLRDQQVLLYRSSDMASVGRLTVSTLVVRAYQGTLPTPDALEQSQHGIEIVGHRGLGQNTQDKTYLQLGENTLESFTSAAKLGATLVEFDVQLTRDLVPVIYHDYSLSETGTDVPIHDLTFEQFMYAGNIQSMKYESSLTNDAPSKTNGVFKRRQRMSVSQIETTDQSAVDMQDRLRQTVAFSSKGFKGNTRGAYVQDSFTTLEELLVRLPPELGFDIELKYPRPHEALAANLAPVALDVNTFVDGTLAQLSRHAKGRRIVLSSFTPEVCIALALKQRTYPVMLITNAGAPPMLDHEKRAASMRAGVEFALQWGLAGIVFHVEVLLLAPRLVQFVKSTGLQVASYGLANNVPENARLQAEAGVDMIIADRVGLVAKALGRR